MEGLGGRIHAKGSWGASLFSTPPPAGGVNMTSTNQPANQPVNQPICCFFYHFESFYTLDPDPFKQKHDTQSGRQGKNGTPYASPDPQRGLAGLGKPCSRSCAGPWVKGGAEGLGHRDARREAPHLRTDPKSLLLGGGGYRRGDAVSGGVEV